MSKTIKTITATILSLAAANSFATEFGKMQIAASPYVPRVYLSGYGGSNWLGQFDLLAPVFVRDDKNLFLYGQGRLAGKEEDWEENTWVGSFGLGYRQMLPKFIVGGYLFADYNNSPIGNNFLTISPGLEAMGDKWDVRINGYFPVGTTEWNTQGWASQQDDYSNVRFAGHEEYDHVYQTTEESADFGFDAEIGYKILEIYHTPIKVYLNGYYFNNDDNENINGIGGKITWDPIKYLTVSLNDSYDNNQNNTILLGLRVNLNFSRNYLDHIADDSVLQARLYEPIDRNFGTLSVANTVPTLDQEQDLGEGLMLDNVWFYQSQNATMTSTTSDYELGTYENPYSNLDQASIDTIETQSQGQPTYIYVASGDYQVGSINLYSNTTMAGWNSDFTVPVSGDDRPTIYGTMTLNSNDSLNDIELLNVDKDYAVGITVTSGASNVQLNDVEVGLTGEQAEANFAGTYDTALYMDNAQVVINNSEINGFTQGPAVAEDTLNAVGISMVNGGKIYVYNSKINSFADAIGSTFNNTGNAYGIHGDGNSQYIEMHDSSIIVDAQGGYAFSGNAFGINLGGNYLDNESALSISNNHIWLYHTNMITDADNYSSGSYSGNGFGILLGFNSASTKQVVKIQENEVNVLAGSYISGIGYGDGFDSGNSDGILIGANSVRNPLSISNNAIVINDSTLFNQANQMPGYGRDGGIAVGVEFGAHAGDGSSFSGKTVVSGNDLTVENSKITTGAASTSYNSGNGFDIFFGVNTLDTNSMDLSINSNNIIVSNSRLESSGAVNQTVGATDAADAFGIAIGMIHNNGSKEITIQSNTVQVNTTTFYQASWTVAGNITRTYGIWLPSGTNVSGNTLTVNGGTNYSSYAGSYMYVGGFDMNNPDGNHSGRAISWQGTNVAWTKVGPPPSGEAASINWLRQLTRSTGAG